jgi:ABC-2 type transport system permease protein
VNYLIGAVAAAFVVLRVVQRRRARARTTAGDGDATSGTRRATWAQSSPLGKGVRRLSALVDTVGGDIGLVARREVRERVKGRTFLVGTIVILLAVAAAVTIPVLNRGKHSTQRVGIVGTLSAPLRATIVASGPEVGTKVQLVDEPSRLRATRALKAGRLALVLVDERLVIVNEALSTSDTSTTALLARVISETVSLQAGLEKAGATPARAEQLAHPLPLPVQSLQAPRHNDTARTTSVYGLILTYVLLTQYGTWLLMGVVEEKSSRVIEVLLSTLRPGQLLAGKVIGIGTVAMFQAALIVGTALGLGAAIGSDLVHGTAPLEVAGSLVWVVLGYAFYCWVWAAAGSLADRQEQVQSLAFPLQLPILFGYIVSFTALGSGQASTLVKVLAYLPPTAPFAMPVLVGLGEATWWGFVLAVAFSMAATVGVARLASAVYYRAILHTGGRVHLREVLASEPLATSA